MTGRSVLSIMGETVDRFGRSFVFTSIAETTFVSAVTAGIRCTL
jgi:hypothetical protein